MYLTFFGLREKPFNLTPDPNFLYLNASYREALAALRYGINERKGFVSLVGEAGTGKTTLLRRLLGELGPEVRTVLILNPAVGFDELLVAILTDLGHPRVSGTPKLQLLQALNAELLETLARGGNVVVLIDEGQDLSIPVLEELRLLSNLETEKEKILQFVISGQPELDAMLARPELRQLRQRIAVPARLRALARGEMLAYIAVRIGAAGGDARGIFTTSALRQLYRFSRGVPRLVNVACDSALVSAYAAGTRVVDRAIMREAIKDQRRGPNRSVVAAVWRTRLATVAVAGVVGGLMGIAAARFAADSAVGRRAVVEPTPAPVRGDAVVAARISSTPAAAPSGDAVAERAGIEGEEQRAAVVAVPPLPEAATSPSRVLPSPAVAIVPRERGVAGVGTAPAAMASPQAMRADESVGAIEATSATPGTAAGEQVSIFVHGGDDLTHIARRNYGYVTPRLLAEIQRENPGMVDPNVLSLGQVIILPPDPRTAVEPAADKDAGIP